MARNVVGLDIGTTAVRAAELSVRRGHVVLLRLGQESLPSGAVVDGEVVDPEAVARSIRALRRRARIGPRRVVLGVANQRVVVRQVELPWMPPAELRRSLAFQAQDYLPIPVEGAELDFTVLAELEGQGGQRLLRVLLVAAQKEMIAGHLQAATRAGLVPVGIDLVPFALLRSVAATMPLSERDGQRVYINPYFTSSQRGDSAETATVTFSASVDLSQGAFSRRFQTDPQMGATTP
jgi:type IV pilus assembly protein PilM